MGAGGISVGRRLESDYVDGKNRDVEWVEHVALVAWDLKRDREDLRQRK